MARGYNNFSYVIDSSFSPFSMQEMLVPFSAYKEEYEKEEEAYNQLTEKADAFKYLAKRLESNPDSEAAQIYKGYADELEARAKDLTQNGLSMGNRRALSNLKRRYRGEIGRLVDADNIRKEQLKEQRSLKLQDPTRMFSRQVEFSSLDDYLSNPDIGYDSYSGALLTQQVATAASNIAKELNDYIKTGRLDAYTKTWIEKHGYSAADVAMAIKNPASDRTGILSSLVSDVVNSSGIPQWGDPATTKRAYEYASQGLWAAIGQSQVHTFDGFGSRLAAQEASNVRLENLRHAHAMEQARAANAGNGVAINPLNLYSEKEHSEALGNIDKFKQYFYTDKNGQVRMNQAGLKEYLRTVDNSGNKRLAMLAAGEASNYDAMEAAKKMPETDTTPFRKFIDSLGGAKFINSKNRTMQSGNLGNKWSQYIRDNNHARYDGTKITEFDYSIEEGQQKRAKDKILGALNGDKLKAVDYDSKSGSFKPTGSSLSVGELSKDDYTVLSTRFSPYGSTVRIKDKNGNVKRYELPSGINTTNEGNRNNAMNKARILQQIIVNGKDLTPQELQLAQQQYAQTLQEAYMYESQLFGANKVKDQELNMYGY